MTSSPWLKRRFLRLLLLLAGVCLAAPAGAQPYRDYDDGPGYPPSPGAWEDYGDDPAGPPYRTRMPGDAMLPGQAMRDRRRGPTADGGQVPLRPGEGPASPAPNARQAPPAAASAPASPAPGSRPAPVTETIAPLPIPPMPEQRGVREAALPDLPAAGRAGPAAAPVKEAQQERSSNEAAGPDEGSAGNTAEAGERPAAALDNTAQQSNPGPDLATAEPPPAGPVPEPSPAPAPAAPEEARDGAASQSPAPAPAAAGAGTPAEPFTTKLGRFFFGKLSTATKQTAKLDSPAAPQPAAPAAAAKTPPPPPVEPPPAEAPPPSATSESLTKLIGRAVFGTIGAATRQSANTGPQPSAPAGVPEPPDAHAASRISIGGAEDAGRPAAGGKRDAMPAPERPEPVSGPEPVKAAATGPQPAAPEQPVIRTVRTLPPAPPPPPADALTKMIGQLVFVGFQGTNPAGPGPHRVLEQASAGRIGGVIFTAGNIQSPDQVRQLVRAMRDIKTETPLFVAVDRESTAAFPAAKGFAEYPSPSDIGRANNLEMAQATYKKMARELAALGFTMDFGPGVNIDSPTAAARRGYGPDPVRVAAFAKIYITAHHEAGLQTVLKDFPGRGGREPAASKPTDIGGAWTEAELEPYRAAIHAKMADIVMTGHVVHPQFSDTARTPVSLSRAGVQRLLRDTIAYEGVSIAGDLDSDAIARDFPLPDRIFRALEAGNDILLFSNNSPFDADLPERVIAILRDAVDSGKISRERIRTSYDRIITLKKKMVRLQKEAPQFQWKAQPPQPTASPAAPVTPEPATPAARTTEKTPQGGDRPKPRSRPAFPGSDAP